MTDPRTDITTVLIDGQCQLCNDWVHFLLPRDRKLHLRFGSQQSKVGLELLAEHGIAISEDAPVSIVVIENGVAFEESTAALRTLARLGQPWLGISKAGTWIPRWLRDPVYRFVARHRYRIFGRRDHCQIGVAGHEEHFLPDN